MAIIADIATLVACLLLCFLCNAAYVHASTRYTLFKSMIGISAASALMDIGYNVALEYVTSVSTGLLYCLYALHTLLALTILLLYIRYFLSLFDIKYQGHALAYWIPAVGYGVIALFMLIAPWCDLGSFVLRNGEIQISFANVLMSAAYAAFLVYMIFLLGRWHNALMPKIHVCLSLTLTLTGALVLLQLLGQTMRYISITLMIPMFVLYALAHHNTYNIELGTLDGATLTSYLRTLVNGRKQFVLVSLKVQQYGEDSIIEHRPINDDFLDKYSKAFYNAYIFRLSPVHNIMIIGFRRNRRDVQLDIAGIAADFEIAYNGQGFNYKLVQLGSDLNITQADDFIRLLAHVEDKAPLNTMYTCTLEDYKEYLQSLYILSELEDIVSHDDMNDSRVLAYCQPVYNRRDNMFDSAEALMRLDLPKCGVVYPDTFIPLAEKSGYIHTLSRIILNKTCKAVHDLLEQGYILNRISVNFAIEEFKCPNFCDDVHGIIEAHGIPSEKIAIELTESQDSYDFQLLSTRMTNLKKFNVKFYLDDFGTGYSNFDRILSLPIDIIKFDKSLLTLAYKNASSQYIVQKFAHIFTKLGYPVQLEGVETDDDEKFSVDLCAEYLQGYKYSKPIPIEELKNFLSRNGEAPRDAASVESDMGA